jgi:S1-C subfamily serine protease
MTVWRAICAALVLATSFTGSLYLIDRATEPQAGSVVKILLPSGGHGSGVHIGDGYIITAQHVVEKLKEVKFQTDATEDQYTADVLWENYGFDIALIKTRSVNLLKTTPVVCRDAVRGEPITAHGNPLDLLFFRATGTISISVVATVDRWLEVIVVSAPIAGGMSGGPVLDSAGNLLAIIVGSVGRIGPFGVAVPVKTVCNLLARS